MTDYVSMMAHPSKYNHSLNTSIDEYTKMYDKIKLHKYMEEVYSTKFSVDYVGLIRMFPEYIVYIENPPEHIQLEAVNINPFVLTNIKNPTPLVELTAVRKDGFALRFVKNQTTEIVIAAIRQNVNAKDFITIPLTDEITCEIVLQSI